MKKKLFSIIMCALMVMCLMPSMAFADSSSTCPGGADCNHAASIGNVHYDTLLEAVKAAQSGDTIKLINDYTVTTKNYPSYLMPENSVLDLGRHTLTIENKGGAVFEGKNITIQNGKFASGTSNATYAIWIGNGENDTSATLKNITSDRGANVYAASAVFEDCTLDVSSHATYYAVWGDTGNVKITIKSGTYKGGSNAAAVNASDGSESGTIVCDPAQITIEGGSFTGKIWVQNNNLGQEGKVVIKGGTYDEDVTKYCAEGYIATKNANDKYVVGLIPDEVVDADLDTDIEQGEPDVKVDENITDKESAKTVAESVSADLKDTKAAENITVSDADKKTAVQKLVADKQIKLDENGNIVPYDDSATSKDVTITIIEEPYLEVEVTELKTDTTTGKKELALDITPKYNLKATTNPDDASKTVTVSTGNTLTVNEKTKVTIELPTGFANSGDKLLVTHTKRNGSIEYLTGSVTAENSKLNLSFTTSSFSLFAVSNEYSASIGEGDDMQVYGTLQSAVDAVKNGETIKLYKDGEKAVVKRTVSFKVDPSYIDKESGATKNYNYTITLGDNCTRKDTGNENEWNITYTAPVSKKSPNTGDNSELGIFAVAGLISAVGVALLLRRKQSN